VVDVVLRVHVCTCNFTSCLCCIVDWMLVLGVGVGVSVPVSMCECQRLCVSVGVRVRCDILHYVASKVPPPPMCDFLKVM
jgi:hypothetical protein